MKTLKKILSLVLVVAVMVPVAVLFTGCTQGTYQIEKLDAGVFAYTRSEYEEKYGKDFDYEGASSLEQETAVAVAGYFSLEFKLKGNGEVVMELGRLPKWFPDEEKPSEDDLKEMSKDLFGENPTWEENEEGTEVIIKNGDTVKFTFEIKDGKLVDKTGLLTLAK